MREGRWASRAQGSKGARGLGRGRRTRGRALVHSGEIVGRRLETADRWGRRVRERGRGGRTASTALAHEAEKERGRGRAQACADRRGPPVTQRGRVGAHGMG
jgi:hypothetical protein